MLYVKLTIYSILAKILRSNLRKIFDISIYMSTLVDTCIYSIYLNTHYIHLHF